MVRGGNPSKVHTHDELKEWQVVTNEDIDEKELNTTTNLENSMILKSHVMYNETNEIPTNTIKSLLEKGTRARVHRMNNLIHND